jgi:hypothetical protein
MWWWNEKPDPTDALRTPEAIEAIIEAAAERRLRGMNAELPSIEDYVRGAN